MSLRQALRARVAVLQDLLLRSTGVRVERVRPSVSTVRDVSRVAYQRRFVRFDIAPGAQVLDLGCGACPFPDATVLVDRFPGATHHRADPLATDGKPFVVAEMDRLPFRDKFFEYVYCSHVLEHAVDPLAVCREIMRVGKRGFIETPTLGKDMLFAWAKGMHTWHVVATGRTLCFFEYSPRQLEGVRSTAWRDIIFSRWWHPLQDVFDANQDLFNVMFTWSSQFSVMVCRLDGRVETFNVERPQTEREMVSAR